MVEATLGFFVACVCSFAYLLIVYIGIIELRLLQRFAGEFVEKMNFLKPEIRKGGCCASSTEYPDHDNSR